MGATRQKRSKSKVKILNGAQQLFWKFGIRKVTVEEICDVAQVSKMTFYRNFPNKKSVVEDVLTNFLNEGMHTYESIMSSESSFGDKIEQVFEMKKKNARNMSEAFVHDLTHINDTALMGLFVNFQKESTERFINDLKTAQEEGWIRKTIKIEFINYMINVIQDEVKKDAFLHLFDSIEEANEQIKNFLFFGIINEKREG